VDEEDEEEEGGCCFALEACCCAFDLLVAAVETVDAVAMADVSSSTGMLREAEREFRKALRRASASEMYRR
jgi:hypothetical protein